MHTLEGTSFTLVEGDWIIKGVKGEFYPIKDEIFRETYEPVDTQRSESDGNYPAAPSGCSIRTGGRSTMTPAEYAFHLALMDELMRLRGIIGQPFRAEVIRRCTMCFRAARPNRLTCSRKCQSNDTFEKVGVHELRARLGLKLGRATEWPEEARAAFRERIRHIGSMAREAEA